MKTLGTTDIRLIAPETLHYKEETPGLERFDNLDQGIEGADVIISLRLQKERMIAADIPDEETYFEGFGLTIDRLKLAKPDAIVMHPGPVNRGIELSSNVADGPQSVILQQVTNGIAVRMAVMEILAGAFQLMSQPINYELAKDALHKLNTDDTISSAHGLLCGFYCVKQDLHLDDWLNEILVSIDLNNLLEKEAHQVLAEIFNNTSEQLGDPTLNFWPVIADDDSPLREQANTLIEWCQGYLVGLGLSSVETSDEEVTEMIKDISEISQLDADLLDTDDNAEDFYEIVEFVRIGVLFIQETLQPSKQDFISPTQLH